MADTNGNTSTPTSQGQPIPPRANPQSGTRLLFNNLSDTGRQNIRQFEEIVGNVLMARSEFIKKLLDPRRDIDDECGFPKHIDINSYQLMFDRSPIAKRVVQVLPRESWQIQPSVYEDEDSSVATEFEKAWDALGRSLQDDESLPDQSMSMSSGADPGTLNFTLDDEEDTAKHSTDTPDDTESEEDDTKPNPSLDGDTDSKEQEDINGGYQDEEGSIIWEYLRRVDEMSGIGNFGILLMGFDDGKTLEQPVDGVRPDGQYLGFGNPTPPPITRQVSSDLGTDEQYQSTQMVYGPQSTPNSPSDTPTSDSSKPKRKLTFLRVYSQKLVEIVRYESDPSNPRLGKPVMYNITMNDPADLQSGIGLSTSTMRVHWSRVIHVAENRENSEVLAAPRMKPVFNNLLGLDKLYGGSPEMYWRGAFPGYSIETHPQLGGDVDVDTDGLRDTMENYLNGLQRYTAFIGMGMKSLAPQVVDPTPQINVQLEAICIILGIPVRVFKGSERGELASSQDDSSWNDRLRERQLTYLSPRIIAPFVMRLINVGVLPRPKGFSISWPDLDSVGKKDKAGIALSNTQALTAYISGSGESVVPPISFLTSPTFLNMDEEEAQAILDQAKKEEEQKQADAQALADEHGMIPEAPDGFQHPEPPPIMGPNGMPMPGQSPVPGGKPSVGKPNPFAKSPQSAKPSPFAPKQPKANLPPVANASTLHEIKRSVDRLSEVINVFCSTGQGGGVDPSCSPGGTGSGSTPTPSPGRGEEAAFKAVHDAGAATARGVASAGRAIGGVAKAAIAPFMKGERSAIVQKGVDAAKLVGSGVAAGAKGVAAAGKAVHDWLPHDIKDTAKSVVGGVVAVEHALEHAYASGQKLATAVAKERGFSDTHVERVGRVLGVADAVARWTGNIPAVHAGLEHGVAGAAKVLGPGGEKALHAAEHVHGLGKSADAAMAAVGGPVGAALFVGAKIGYYVPVASLAYVGYHATRELLSGRNPISMINRARGRVKESMKTSVHKAEHEASHSSSSHATSTGSNRPGIVESFKSFFGPTNKEGFGPTNAQGESVDNATSNPTDSTNRPDPTDSGGPTQS